MSNLQRNMKPIKNIIVATDFSDTSRNAYRYAKELAKTLQASLTMVHVITDLIMVSDVMILPLNTEENLQLIKDMEQIVSDEESVGLDKLENKQSVKVKLLKGNPETEIAEMSNNGETDLIVMGATGSTDMLDKLFGSTSHNVSNNANCPVILVPKNVKWQPINQIMFASNYDSILPEMVNNVNEFALSVRADMHFVNVKNFDPVFEIQQKEVDWDNLMVADLDIVFEKHTIYGNDTIEQLKLYSEEKNIDLMVFVSKHRNFWQSLVHKSITQQIILSSVLPIMVMHLDDK